MIVHVECELREAHWEDPMIQRQGDPKIADVGALDLEGFWAPNWYAVEPDWHTWYLVPEAVESLYYLQGELLDQDASLLIVDAYRSRAEQAAALRSKPHLAVSPEQSNHTRGLAIDVRGYEITQSRLADLLTEYGWRQHPHEAWHFDFLT